MLALSDTFLISMLNTLQAELGEKSHAVVKDMGRDWGRRAAEQFAADLRAVFARFQRAGKVVMRYRTSVYIGDRALAGA